MNKWNVIVSNLMAFVLLAILVSCSSNTPDIAGTGSQAGNGVVVIATASYSESSQAAANVDVFVRSADFLPQTEYDTLESRKTVTSTDGFMEVLLPRDSVMAIQLVDNNGYAFVTFCSTYTNSDTIHLGSVPLEREAVFTGSVDRSSLSDSVPLYVQVYGLNKHVAVNSDGTFKIDHMPAGTFSFRIVTGDLKDAYFDREPFALGPDDTLDLGVFDPSENVESDTLIVRSLLDLNGLTAIPVSSVITKGEFGTIETLDLRSRNIDTIVPEIGKLSVKRLLLGDNSLQSLPREIEFLNSLEELDLSGNDLVQIPTSLYNLRNLRLLNVANCSLVDLHKDIGKLRYLRKLDLSANALTTVPEELGMLKDLEELDLSGNTLSSLPYQITFLDKLIVLNVENNQLKTVDQEIEFWITEKSGSESWKESQK